MDLFTIHKKITMMSSNELFCLFLDCCRESKRSDITGQCHNSWRSWIWPASPKTECISGL